MTDDVDLSQVPPELHALIEEVRHDIADLSETIGRPLAPEEREAIAYDALDRAERGERLNSESALVSFHAVQALNRAKGARDLDEDIEHDCEQLERELGRELLIREREAIEEDAERQARRHDRIDVKAALQAHYRDRGEEMPDPDTGEGRQAIMAERLQDKDPDRNADSERELDLDDEKDRVAYMTLRAGGLSREDFEDVPSEGSAESGSEDAESEDAA